MSGQLNTLADGEQNDLARIVALPKRSPVDCERERGHRRWAPEAQALIEVVTAKYSRGPRIACACRDRHVIAERGGALTIFQAGPPGAPPSLPKHTTIVDFARDNAHDPDTVKIVQSLRAGASVDLKGLGYPTCVTEFNPVQAWTLRELPRAGGITGFCSVGSGKTFAGIMVPLAMTHLKVWAILIKPTQMLHYRKAYLRLREHFKVPSIVFDGADMSGSYIVPGTPVLHVLRYTLLSNMKSTQLLESLDPDGMVFDESHLLANKTSSRTMRVLRFLTKRNNEDRSVVVCDWSGSKIKKSLRDVAHLSAHALGLGSPYPIDPDEVDCWSGVIDPVTIPDRTSSTAHALRRAFGTRQKINSALFEAGLVSDGGIREGHRDRVIWTPGVISTRSSSVNCSISIERRDPPPLPDKVLSALTGVRTDAVRPDGEELVEATEIALCARTVGSGYHYCWVYPRGEEPQLIEEWFAARKRFSKELRSKLLNGEPHLDSRKLCENAAERAWRKERYEGDLPVWPAETWPAWQKIKDKVEPHPKTRWIDDFLAKDAAKWAQENIGVVWCQSTAFGRRVAELAGVNYHGGGPNAEERIHAEDGKKSIIVSLRAHGESLDGLQLKFCKQLVAELPSSGDKWEQLLGRLAREGQQADTVETFVFLHTSENRDAWRSAWAYAQFIEATTPNQQLLLSADVGFDI